ncbi:MAG: hypothetical protein R2834_23920 [Rhodothermales bacterium]
MALVVFSIYTLLVFSLAWFAHIAGKRRASFLGEYFLGSRELGMFALALTYGATSASAGSFAGFPALIYTHGWSLALWIASYMIFPLCGMGLLGKRLNVFSRRSGAITLPDILRARFDSPALALLASGFIAAMLLVYLIPQFKLAAIIMEQLLRDVPAMHTAAVGMANAFGGVPGGESPEYVFCLLVFAVLVIVYTTFGGFRAVVWTDMLQGAVMSVGVIVMLVLTLQQVGGLDRATQALDAMTPPLLAEIVYERATPAEAPGILVPVDTWVAVADSAAGGETLLRANQSAFIPAGETVSAPVVAVALTTPEEIAAVQAGFEGGRPAALPMGVAARVVSMRPYAAGAGEAGVYVRAPGPSPTDAGGFLPLGLALSFFVFWALSGTGQPGNMVRLMAFDSTQTLKRGIAALSIYFTLIYLPLVVIFVCARLIVPGIDQSADRIMPLMAFTLADAARMPWLAGLIIAAPFAAAMSTVDSFLLMIASSVVRDMYQQHVNPSVSEARVRAMSYTCTLIVGGLATVGALYPPQFLQYVIVFSGGGLSAAFLAPMALGLYWPRFNKAGALAAMLGGFGAYLAMYVVGFVATGTTQPWRPAGLDPLIWGFAASLIGALVATMATPPPPRQVVQTFFGRPAL